MSLPLTYPDLVCDVDLDPFGTETTSDLQNLVQDVTHVLVELQGSNPDDPLRGVGIETYLSGTVDSLNGLPGVVEKQLGEDDRLSGVNCTINQNPDGSFFIFIDLNVSGTVVPLQFSWGPNAGLTQVL